MSNKDEPVALRGGRRSTWAIGVSVAALVFALRTVVTVPVPWLLVLAVVLVLVTPTSTSYSRRILLNGAVLLGWLPLVWWLPLPLGADRVAIAMALLAGGAAVAIALRARSGLGAVLPRPRLVDAIPVAAAALATWVHLPLLRPRGDTQALQLLLNSGWDHVAHYYMVRLVAGSGSVPATFGEAPDGGANVAATYPKHFHTLVDGVIGLLGSPSGVAAVTPSHYLVAVVVVIILSVTVLAAGVAQLPWLRARARLAWPLAGLAVCGLLFGPGTQAIAAGYPNFIFGCIAAAICSFIAVGMSRAVQPVHAVALAGMIVAAAHSWLPLVPLGALAALAIIRPLRRRWVSTRPAVIVTVAAIGSTVVGVVTALVIVAPDLQSSTVLIGDAERFDPGLIAVVLGFDVAAMVVLLLQRRGAASSATRAAVVGMIGLVAIAMLVVVGYQQVRDTGHLLYYFTKLSTGAILIVTCTLVIQAAALARRSRAPRSRPVAVLSAVVLGGLSLQIWGYVGPGTSLPTPPVSQGLTYRSAAAAVLGVDGPAPAERLEQAVHIAEQHPFGATVYFARMPGDPIPSMANQWHQSLSGNWSVLAHSSSALIDRYTTADRMDDLHQLLRHDDDALVIVDPEILDEARGSLTPDEVSRLLSW